MQIRGWLGGALIFQAVGFITLHKIGTLAALEISIAFGVLGLVLLLTWNRGIDISDSADFVFDVVDDVSDLSGDVVSGALDILPDLPD